MARSNCLMKILYSGCITLAMATTMHSMLAFSPREDLDYEKSYPLDVPARCYNYKLIDAEVTKFFEDAVDCTSSCAVSLPMTPQSCCRRRCSMVSVDSRWLVDPAPTPSGFEQFSYLEPSSPPPVVACFSSEYHDREDSMLEWRETKWQSLLSEPGSFPLWRIPWPVFFFDDFDLADDDHTRMEMINFISVLGSTYERRIGALQKEITRWTTKAIAPYALRVRPEEREEVLERTARVYSLLCDVLYEEKWHSVFRE